MAKKKDVQKRHFRKHKKVGKAPGTITYMGNREAIETKVTIIEYTDNLHKIHYPGDIEQIVAHKDTPTTSWVNVVGLNDESFIEKVGHHFGLNTLILEDIVNTQQRPKIDEYENYIFGTFRMLYINDKNELVGEHVALVLMQNCVLVFQELDFDVFNGVRERINAKSGRIRTKDSDYLFFALLDSIIDNYFVVLENVGHKIEALEDDLYENPTPEVAHNIQQLKKEVLKIRQWIYPVKEIVNRLIDSESTLLSKDTKFFLRDALDHSYEINESLQIYREMAMSLMEMYMSNMSNKMNEVMKVLTIMSAIFIPMTFIAGVYGMNFVHIPELQWENGYFLVWGLMILIFIGMLIFFKKKKWI
ncbi:magnesium/cobalt transporter CorA [Maribacter polysaccharolyticus]|uniref:magnesium/cobalt transporter CorA n=1 Tax=Maribacter polysaccharolyticus TaxID=3020831 RepID=UPI00237F8FA1|nr:magnesium/cobalt transporter CorA [Maribacter polysaccharolyticus]MDE3740406.1 magnesium/cobalt transporter CorA [Maribacter polysaccharolyticus]